MQKVIVDDNLTRYILSFLKLDLNFFLFRRVSKLWKKIVDDHNKEYVHVSILYFNFQKCGFKIETNSSMGKLIFRISNILCVPPHKIGVNYKNYYFESYSNDSCSFFQEENNGLNRIKMVWSTLPIRWEDIRFGLYGDY